MTQSLCVITTFSSFFRIVTISYSRRIAFQELKK